MTSRTARRATFALSLFGLLGLAGCYHEGPAERAGRGIDNIGKDLHDAVVPPAGPAEAAGRKVDRALGN